jgi:transposase
MFFVGIDVGKRRHEAVILDGEGHQRGKPFQFSNTRAGVEALQHHVQAQPEACLCAVEATGHYWLALYAFLHAAGLPMTVINPLQTHAYRASLLRKTKTDARDAWVIADLLRIGRGRATYVPGETILQLRELSRFRFSLIDQIGDLKRKLLSILDRVFPEYETLFSDVFRKGSRALLAEAATAEAIAAFDLTELTELLETASRGRFGAAKAREIQQVAAQSLGVAFLADAAQVEVQCLLAQVAFLEQQIGVVDGHLATLLQQLPASDYLMSITGIGLVFAAAILGEIGDIQRFDAPEQLVAFAGLDPSVHQSGQFTADHAVLSKRGSSYLRRALWLAAHTTRLCNPDLQAVYERKRRQGKCHKQATTVVAHRLLNRIYVVLKEQRPYVVRDALDDSQARSAGA